MLSLILSFILYDSYYYNHFTSGGTGTQINWSHQDPHPVFKPQFSSVSWHIGCLGEVCLASGTCPLASLARGMNKFDMPAKLCGLMRFTKASVEVFKTRLCQPQCPLAAWVHHPKLNLLGPTETRPLSCNQVVLIQRHVLPSVFMEHRGGGNFNSTTHESHD